MKPKNSSSQMELFQTRQNKPRVAKKRGLDSIKTQIETEQRHVINVPYENIILSVIGILFLVILSFCLGAKRGESILRTNMGQLLSDAGTISNLADGGGVEEQTDFTVVEPQDQGNLEEASVVEESVSEEADMPVVELPAGENKYTIQLITYSRQSQARLEIDKLKTAGVDAFFLVDGRYYKVCSGAYSDTTGAKNDLNRFKRNRWYKDCFVKKYSKSR